MRIALMVLRLFFKAFYYFGRIWWCSIHENISYEEGFRWAKKTTLAANRAGRRQNRSPWPGEFTG